MNETLPVEYGVRDSPTITLFSDGQPLAEYAGDGSAQSIASFVAKRVGTPSTRMKTRLELDELLGETEGTVVVGVFPSGKAGHAARKIYLHNARLLHESIKFVEVSAKLANLATVFKEAKPFKSAVASYAVVPPQRWVAKNERCVGYASNARRP